MVIKRPSSVHEFNIFRTALWLILSIQTQSPSKIPVVFYANPFKVRVLVTTQPKQCWTFILSSCVFDILSCSFILVLCFRMSSRCIWTQREHSIDGLTAFLPLPTLAFAQMEMEPKLSVPSGVCSHSPAALHLLYNLV